MDRTQQKLRFIFDSSKVDIQDPEIKSWLNTVKKRVGLKPINPEPYWGFEDLKYAIGEKLKNCFYVIADSKIENKHEYFYYKKLLILSGFSFEKFLKCMEGGGVLIDFDARTGHNHGTKIRVKQEKLPRLYKEAREA